MFRHLGSRIMGSHTTLSALYGSARRAGVKTNNCIRINSGLRAMMNYSSLTPMNELERLRAIEEYTREFVEKTNDGKVFTLDMSFLDTRPSIFRKHLTDEETKDRKDWINIRYGLYKHYTLDIVLKNLTVKEMLLLRVAPPVLDSLAMSWRSEVNAERRRVYPDKMYSWKDFESEVRSFTEPTVEKFEVVEGALEAFGNDDVLYHSLNDVSHFSSEEGEKYYVVNQVLNKLQKAGLLKHGARNQAQWLDNSHTLGPADHFLIAGKNKTVPIEFKPTHNLLVPETALKVVRRYNAALRKFEKTGEPPIHFVNVANPLAQLYGYMVVAGSRYGVLSSGSRSYFVKVVEDAAGVPRVLITDAWFIGQKDYLRAWSYLYHLAKGNGDFQYLNDLEKTEGRDGADDSTDERPSSGDDRNRGPGGLPTEQVITWLRPSKGRQSDDRNRGPEGPPPQQFMTWLDPGVAPSIPRVDGRDIKFVRLLGQGNNEVFLALWKGQEVAVKIFNPDKNLEFFESEIRAYEHLKDAWGVLVPKPYFIADYICHVLLGMQLGRAPNSSDSEIKSERDILFRTLKRDYGFDHLDVHSGNVLYLPDASRTAPARLVAIDFEAHEIRQGRHGK